MNTTPSTPGHDLANLAFLALIVLIVLFINLTWPVGPIFVIGGASWLLLGVTTKRWLLKVRHALTPILLGLGAFALLQLVCNLFVRRVDPERIRAIELGLVSAQQALERATGWSTPRLTLLILSVLLAATFVKPRLKLVSRYLRLNAVLASVLTALTAATTFTFFSSEPIVGIARDLHAENVERYQSSVRRQKNAVGKYLAANVVKNAAASFDQAERDRFAALLKKISECPTVPTTQPAREGVLAIFKCRPDRLAVAMATTATDAALKQPSAGVWLEELLSGFGAGAHAGTEDEAAPRMPVTAAEWRAERDAAAAQSARADSVADELRRAEAAAAIDEFASSVLRVPMEYVAESVPFIDQVRDVLAAWIVETSRARRWPLPMTLSEAKLKWDTFIEHDPNCCKELLIPRGGNGPLIASANAAEFERAVDRTVADGIDELRQAEEAAIKDRGRLSSGDASRPGIDSDRLKDLLQDRAKDAAHPERASER